MKPEIQALIDENVMKVMRDGPRNRNDYNQPIIARNRAAKMVLIGGLGCLGVGTWWVPEGPHHADHPGFADAPEQSLPAEGP